MAPRVDVFDGGGPPWWQRGWTALPPRRRRWALVAVGVLLAVGGAVVVRDVVAARRQAERVVLAAALAVETSSTSPPGGAVLWSVAVRNDGARPVRLISLDGAAGGLVLRSRPTVEQPVPAGREAQLPLSVRLTCPVATADLPARLDVVVRVRAADGRTTSRRVPLTAADPLDDAAATLCSVIPGLRDRELSGPAAARRVTN